MVSEITVIGQKHKVEIGDLIFYNNFFGINHLCLVINFGESESICCFWPQLNLNSYFYGCVDYQFKSLKIIK